MASEWMKRVRALLPAAALCLSLQARAPLAQEGGADAERRVADEAASTVEARRAALSSLLEDARRLREAGEASAAGRALNRAGRLRLRLNSPQEALTVYREALGLLRGAGNEAFATDSLNGLGAASVRLGRCPEAESHLRRALGLSDRLKYLAGRAEALGTLSACQNYHDHALALDTARQSLAIWQTLGDRRGEAEASATVGHYQLAQNDLDGSQKSYEAALDRWRGLGEAGGQAEALIMLGFVEYRRGAWQNVISLLTQAQGLLDEEAEPYMMGQIAAGLADAYIESGLPELGPDRFRQAQEYYRRASSPRDVMVMSWELGRGHYILGEYAVSLAHLREALAAAESMGEQTMVAMCHESLGLTLAATGEEAEALGHLRVALDLYGRVSNPMEAARVRALTGRVYARQGKVGRAREYYQSALATFRALSDRLNESATLYALGRLELDEGNLAEAEAALSRSIELTENVWRGSTSRDLAAAFSATVHDRYEAYAECLMREHEAEPARGLDVRAFESSESSRARSLVEQLRATETRPLPGLDPQLAEQESALRRLLRAKEDERVLLLAKRYKPEELEAINAELSRLEADYKALDETIHARHAVYEQIASPVGWTLGRIQQRVVADDETVLLEYSLGAERSYVWAVTRDRIETRELPPRGEVAEAARRLYELLSDPRRAGEEEAMGSAAGELSRMILSPVGGVLGRRRVIVVGDDALNYIPFQLLPDPSSPGGEPLVAAHEVVGAPSASTLGQLREETARRSAHAKTLAAFGDPVFSSNYAMRRGGGVEVAALMPAGAETRGLEVKGDLLDPNLAEPLRFAGEELQSLSEVVAGDEALVASGFDATRERLRATDLGQFSILHFATHGVLDPRQPEKSGLILSTVDERGRGRDGLVSLRDIYDLRAPVDLVVLSACRTALGKDVQGEGLIGLTRGFMYAGASGVVSSLWKVDDEAASVLMKLFYENMLRKGMTPAEALRAAQNTVRQNPAWRSPHYWAAFTLQGEFRQSIRPARSASALYAKAAAAALLLLGLAASAFWLHRRRRAARA
jgi:CHAT domain-containing protein